MHRKPHFSSSCYHILGCSFPQGRVLRMEFGKRQRELFRYNDTSHIYVKVLSTLPRQETVYYIERKLDNDSSPSVYEFLLIQHAQINTFLLILEPNFSYIRAPSCRRPIAVFGAYFRLLSVPRPFRVRSSSWHRE